MSSGWFFHNDIRLRLRKGNLNGDVLTDAGGCVSVPAIIPLLSIMIAVMLQRRYNDGSS